MNGLNDYTVTNKIKKSIVTEAVTQAILSNHKQRIGCVIFKGKRIISSAHNAVRSNKIPHKFKNFLESSHAEAQCIIKARRNLKDYDILVVRLNNKGEMLLAKPCEFCQDFIDFVGIRNVYYSTNDGEIVRGEN